MSFLQSGTAELSEPPPPRQHQEPLNCPRCGSINTKFCYYNNYNKSQPRHFCKSCKRHWTQGGTLRSVPAGGGRKNKRAHKALNPAATVAADGDGPHRKSRRSSPFTISVNTDQKNMSDILYQALARSNSPHLLNNAMGLSASVPAQNQTTQLPFSSLSSGFDENICVINSTSYDQSLNDDVNYQYAANLYWKEESTITTTDIPTTSTAVEFPGYWQWNGIGELASSGDDLNIAWDHDVYAWMKP